MSGDTNNHKIAAMTAGIINNWKVIVQPSDATNAPAKNGLNNAPMLPHKFIQPDTVPAKFLPMSFAAQLIPIDTPIPPKPSDNQKIVTYKFSVCTAKKIETANTMKPTMAIKPLETNLDCPLRKILSEIAPEIKLK